MKEALGCVLRCPIYFLKIYHSALFLIFYPLEFAFFSLFLPFLFCTVQANMIDYFIWIYQYTSILTYILVPIGVESHVIPLVISLGGLLGELILHLLYLRLSLYLILNPLQPFSLLIIPCFIHL